MTNFNERTNTLLYKKYISHTLFPKGLMLVVYERWTGDGDRLLFWSKVLLATIAALLLHLGCVAQPWVTEGPKPSVCRWLSLRHLVSNWLEPPRAPGYIIVSCPPASAVLPLIYTGAFLEWRLGRGSICYTRLTCVRQLLFLLLSLLFDNFSSLFPIVHRLRQVFWTTSHILT